MAWLSPRLVRLVLLASGTSLFSYASPVLAQIPALGAEPPSEPSAPAAPALPASPAAPAAAPALPPSPPPPAGAPTLPASPNAPAPAKADRITAPDAQREAEASVDERDEESEDARTAQASEWYGWQTLIADAPSLTAFVAGVSMSGGGTRNGSTLIWAGFLGYELLPGVIHFVHRNPGRGFASFGIRFGMPLAGLFIGASLASGCNKNWCEASGAGVGALLGMGGAIAIDAAVFAYDDPRPSIARRGLLVPLASVTLHQAWIGVGGAL